MTTDTTVLPPADGSTGGRRPQPGPRTAVQVLAVLLSLLLVGWCALTVVSLLARGSGQAHGTFTGVRTLALDTGFESVDVAGSAAGTTVTMQRSYHWSLGRPTVRARQDGDVLRISSSCPFQVGIGCTGTVRLVVPAGVQVRADTRDGHLTLRDLTGPVDGHHLRRRHRRRRPHRPARPDDQRRLGGRSCGCARLASRRSRRTATSGCRSPRLPAR